MRQMALKLKIYAGNVNVVNNDMQKIFFRAILWSFGALAILYLLFLGNMVKNIVERRSFEANARTLGNEVRDLELTYLSLSNNVDLAFSHSLGFKETQATFATRKALGFGSAGVKVDQNDL